jgi:multiple sugar transport system substrate-binding protein
LLRKLGPDDYQKPFTGKLSFADPRVVAVLKWVKELADAGAYPKNFIPCSANRTTTSTASPVR